MRINFKFALRFPLEDLDQALVNLNLELGEEVTAVSCGYGDVDIIVTGIHKAHGIQLLQQRWQIANDKTAAFGDSGNDIEMLRHVHYSYAMEHASELVKRTAKYQIGSNNAEAVLDATDLDPILWTLKKDLKLQAGAGTQPASASLMRLST